jgi:hypothetical protein
MGIEPTSEAWEVRNKANDDALRHGFEQAGPQATGHIKILMRSSWNQTAH